MKQDKSFKWTPSSLESLNLSSLKVAIIGGTGGLGRAIGVLLARLGAEVIVVGQTFRDEGVKNLTFIRADLSSMEVSKEVAQRLATEALDILLFTAGIFASSERQVTAEDLERDMAVSYLNRLVMIKIIVPKLKKAKNVLGFTPRVFVMGYPGSGQLGTIDDLNQENNYGLMKTHMSTVAGNEALVLLGADYYPGVNFYGLNPGIVKTNIRNNLLGENSWKSYILEGLIGLITKTPEQYAARIVPLLVAPEIEERTGTMYNDKGDAIFASDGMTNGYAASYIQASEDLLNSKGISN